MVKTIRKIVLNDPLQTWYLQNLNTVGLSYYRYIAIPSVIMVLGEKRTMVYQANSRI